MKNRVLKSGLDIYIESALDLEIIPDLLLEKWRSLLNSPTIPWLIESQASSGYTP
jgi:hypothetical protein